MKIVLDTNLFIAAYFNRRSSSAKIIEGCLQDKYKAAFSAQIVKEIYLILRNIKAKENFLKKIEKLLQKAIMVENPPKVKVVSEDPDDDKFIACALEENADYIITSDTHLLKLKRFKDIKICKPSQFLKTRITQIKEDADLR